MVTHDIKKKEGKKKIKKNPSNEYEISEKY
jgi:hypothetical protein